MRGELRGCYDGLTLDGAVADLLSKSVGSWCSKDAAYNFGQCVLAHLPFVPIVSHD